MLRHEPPSGCLSAAALDDELSRTTTRTTKTSCLVTKLQLRQKSNLDVCISSKRRRLPAINCPAPHPLLSLSTPVNSPPVDSPPHSHSVLCKPDYNVSNPLCPVRDLGTKSVQCSKNLKTTFLGSVLQDRTKLIIILLV